MKIEIKNVKENRRMSTDSTAFSAALFIDGKARGSVCDRGTGGAMEFSDHKAEQEIEEYAKTLPGRPYNLGDGAEGMLSMSADVLIGDLLNEQLLAADLKKALSKRILFVKNGQVVETKKALKMEDLKKFLAQPNLSKLLGSDQILNLMAFDAALALYKQITPR